MVQQAVGLASPADRHDEGIGNELGRHLAFIANAASVFFLLRYKDGDANVRSVWLCSRDEAIGNAASCLQRWGEAAIMTGIFLVSSVQILRQAWSEYREALDPVWLTSVDM